MDKNKSIRQMAIEHGLKVSTVHYRVKTKGMTLEEALTTPDCRSNAAKLRWKKHRQNRTVRLEEKPDKPCIKKLAEEKGLKYSTVMSRISKQGMSIQEALNTPVKDNSWKEQWGRDKERMRTYKLKVFVATSPEGDIIKIYDLPAFCKQKEFKYDTVITYIRMARLYKGWKIERAQESDKQVTQPTK